MQDRRVNAIPAGVSFVVPVLNGARTLRQALASMVAEQDGRPFEIIAIEDGSIDGSLRILQNFHREGVVRLLPGPRRGAAAAINAGIREAVHPIICQVDQDVILQQGWLRELLQSFCDPEVAAAQGHYTTHRDAGFWARATGRDLEHRYSRIRGPFIDHACTGNTAYLARALHQVGLLDERMGYGYDNDLSYRLHRSGYKLAFCRNAISVHCWREGFNGYLRQQFGVGYGRLDVVVRHPRRIAGDDVSGTTMMLHAPAMTMAILMLVLTPGMAAAGLPWHTVAIAGLVTLGALITERAVAGINAWRHTRDRSALAFPLTHIVRDVAWSAAIVAWLGRWALKRERAPGHSMFSPPRLGEHSPPVDARQVSVLAVVPAFNECANLPRVVADLSRVLPRKDIVIVDDGSTDGTAEMLPQLGVKYLTLSQRLGVGGAVRAGIRYARRRGYDYVVRVDGDAQHRACDIVRLLAPVVSGQADAALGSRFLHRRREARDIRRLSQALLACGLRAVTRRSVTDPTSGFWLFGPRALRLLSGHHPAGYAEPELLLFLSRNGLHVTEVPIRMRPRTAGRTSLTVPRTLLALARTVLAFVIVPFRRLVEGQAHD
jgi:glycosyltransferase involved in cell wall biosynthesis